MKLFIIKTFIVSYRKLFVLVAGNIKLTDLQGSNRIFNNDLKINMIIHSLEMVNFSNEESAVGITINYQSQNQLELLESLKVGDHIYVA